MSKILKNQTASDILLDVGITVLASSNLTLPPQDYDEAAASDDLVEKIGSGDIIVNDGSSDLSKSDGIRLIQGGDSRKVQLDDDLIVTDRIKVDVQGTLSDSTVKVSSNDATMGFLETKIVSADNKIAISTLNDGGDEDLQIQLQSANINTSELENDANFIDSSGAPVQPADIADFETSTELDARDVANRNRANHTGTQLAITISDFNSAVQTAETTTGLSFNLGTNTLSYTDEDGGVTNIDLSPYLDDTNLSRIVSGVLDAGTGICTFTRDDLTTFDVDFSSLNDQAFINAAIATHETTIGNHDDVDLTGNATDALLKFNGTNFVPFIDYKVFANFSSPVGTQSTAYQQALRLNYNIPQAGNYKITVSYIWSINTTGSNFEARVELNDTDLFFEHSKESQDSGGTGVTVTNLTGGTFNSGTDQKIDFSYSDVVNLPVGVGFIDLDIANQTSGTEATFHRASIILERFN